jgi:hypothetical protein
MSLELDAAKFATINECNKNAVLLKQLELTVNEKSALERELVVMAELRKENALLKVIGKVLHICKFVCLLIVALIGHACWVPIALLFWFHTL